LGRDCDAVLEKVKDEVFEEGRANTDEVLPDPNAEGAWVGVVLFDPNRKLLEDDVLLGIGFESNANPFEDVPLTPEEGLFPGKEYTREPDET
jgi:hypothetical protein